MRDNFVTVILTFLLVANLQWTHDGIDTDGYRIYRDKVFLGIAGPKVYRDETAKPGSCYYVTAFNQVGESGPSNTVCLPLIPKNPGDLKIKIEITIP